MPRPIVLPIKEPTEQPDLAVRHGEKQFIEGVPSGRAQPMGMYIYMLYIYIYQIM